MHQKLAPDPFLILLNYPKQPLHATKCFKNKTFWKRIIKKLYKGLLYLFYWTHPLLMDKVIKNKRGPFVLLNLESVERKVKNYKNFVFLIYFINNNSLVLIFLFDMANIILFNDFSKFALFFLMILNLEVKI